MNILTWNHFQHLGEVPFIEIDEDWTKSSSDEDIDATQWTKVMQTSQVRHRFNRMANKRRPVGGDNHRRMLRKKSRSFARQYSMRYPRNHFNEHFQHVCIQSFIKFYLTLKELIIDN